MMKAKNDPSGTCHLKKSFSEPNITANGGREIAEYRNLFNKTRSAGQGWHRREV